MGNSLVNFHNLKMTFNWKRPEEVQRGYCSNLMNLMLNYFIDFGLLLHIFFSFCNTGFDNIQTNTMKWYIL